MRGGAVIKKPSQAREHLIRRSGHIVQDRPSPVVGWADIPELSTCVGRRPVAWLQRCLQSWRNAADPVAITADTITIDLASDDTRVVRRTTTQPVRSIKAQQPRKAAHVS